jgi:enamine deaminase RidA (YjgF/YER057c/UK114 family)
LSAGQASEGSVRRLSGDPPSPYEQRYSFSRVIQTGPWALVGGTTSVTPDGVVLGDTPYAQTIEALGKVLHELSRAGARVADIVQTRVYVTDISRGDEVARAHAELLGEVRPVMTLVEVSALIDPRMLVEVEAVAYVGRPS